MTTRNEKRQQEFRQQTIAHMLGALTWAAAAETATNGFTMKILRAMQESELGLDAATQHVRGYVYRELHDMPLDVELGETPAFRQEIGELFEKCLDAAAAHMKERVDAARQLVALADR